jgi:hypothetical protein
MCVSGLFWGRRQWGLHGVKENGDPLYAPSVHLTSEIQHVHVHVEGGRSFRMFTSISMSRHVLAILLVTSGLDTQAAPLERDGELQSRENENTHITTGEPPSDRTIFVMISIPCVAVLAFLLGMLPR